MGSPDKNRPPLTQAELEEGPGSPLPERVAMSLLGGGSALLHPGPIPIPEPPPSAEAIGGEAVDSGSDEA